MRTNGDGDISAAPSTEGGISASARGLCKAFSQGAVVALQGLDFTARRGEVTALIGANGSGKTTLLKILFGLLRPDNGAAEVVGLDPRRDSRALRGRVGYVAQHQSLDPEMTGRETLGFFAALYAIHGDRRRRRVAELSALFGLDELLDRYVAEYSGGYRQRLHLAIGLLHDPPLLLFDEPTSGLDPQGRALFWKTMRAHVGNGRAAVIATHELDDVARSADRVALLSQGATKMEATPGEAIARHGRAVLDIAFDEPPASWAPLRDRWQALDGLERVEVDQRRVTLHLRDSKELDKQVFAVAHEAGLTASSYRREPPSLESAYFQLTGQRLAVPPAAPLAGRGRRRRP